MRRVTQLAVVDPDTCIGCKICEKVCPTLAIHVVDNVAEVTREECTGCSGCEQRCPTRAIVMVGREDQRIIEFEWDEDIQEEVNELCRKADFHPEQIICYCTETRAEELAAAVLAGNDTPEKLSAVTGIRTGCKIECVQPILRILNAAGITPTPPEGGFQWYGLTPTVFDISENIKEKYKKGGFNFDADIELFEDVINHDTKGGTK